MFPAKIYVGQIAVVSGIVVASTWGATQWTAGALGFQSRLGEPWFVIVEYPVYQPWRLFEWWFAYEAYAPEIFEKGGRNRGGGRCGRRFVRNHQLGVAGPTEPAGDHLRFSAVGNSERNPERRPVRCQGRVSGTSRK